MAKISKRHNSVKGGVMVLFLCTSSDGGLYLNKVNENIPDSIKIIEQTPFL